MKRIGLTGSIGSGKSTVARLLRAKGIPVLDADAVARAVSGFPEVRSDVAAQFGSDYVLPDGLNRPKLAELVFHDPDARSQLNAIIHPRVRAEMARQQSQLEVDGVKAVVQDIPLLFENGLQSLFDLTILVDAPLETRIARVTARDGSTREQVVARDAAQMPASEKRNLASHILENDSDEPNLAAQLEAVLEAVLEELKL